MLNSIKKEGRKEGERLCCELKCVCVCIIYLHVYDAYDSLKVGGKLTFVTINGLRSFMKTNFQEVFGNYKKLKQGKNYTVSQAIKIK